MIALLGYQSVTEARRTDSVKRLFGLHEQALIAKEYYDHFLSGVVDAVDTQRLGPSALRALGEAAPSCDHRYPDQSCRAVRHRGRRRGRRECGTGHATGDTGLPPHARLLLRQASCRGKTGNHARSQKLRWQAR